MKTLCTCLGIVTGIVLILFPGLCLAQIMDEVDTPFQICCVGKQADADALATRLASNIPGLQTRVERESCQDSLGTDVSYYALYVWHADMTAEDICHELGKKECVRCQRQVVDVCPEDSEDMDTTGE